MVPGNGVVEKIMRRKICLCCGVLVLVMGIGYPVSIPRKILLEALCSWCWGIESAFWGRSWCWGRDALVMVLMRCGAVRCGAGRGLRTGRCSVERDEEMIAAAFGADATSTARNESRRF